MQNQNSQSAYVLLGKVILTGARVTLVSRLYLLLKEAVQDLFKLNLQAGSYSRAWIASDFLDGEVSLPLSSS